MARASSTCDTRTGAMALTSSSRISRLRSERLVRMISMTPSVEPFMATANTAASMPRRTCWTSRFSSLTMSAKVSIRERTSSARTGSLASRASSSARSVATSERLMISTRGWMPPTTSLVSREEEMAPTRPLSVSVTTLIASGVAVPMVAMHCATSTGRVPSRPASTAEACSGRRWARTSAMVWGNSPSSRASIWRVSAVSRNSNALPAIDEATLVITPAAFSAPKDASSRPTA